MSEANRAKLLSFPVKKVNCCLSCAFIRSSVSLAPDRHVLLIFWVEVRIHSGCKFSLRNTVSSKMMQSSFVHIWNVYKSCTVFVWKATHRWEKLNSSYMQCIKPWKIVWQSYPWWSKHEYEEKILKFSENIMRPHVVSVQVNPKKIWMWNIFSKQGIAQRVSAQPIFTTILSALRLWCGPLGLAFCKFSAFALPRNRNWTLPLCLESTLIL